MSSDRSRQYGVLILAIVLSSCASGRAVNGGTADPSSTARTPSKRATPSLEARVSEYWARRQARDLAGIYPYYSSDYRARVSPVEFLKQNRLVRFDLSDVVIGNIVGSADRAEVTVAYGLMVPKLGGDKLTSQSVETWVREPDGNWYKLDEPLQLPFPAATPAPATLAR